MINKIPAKCWFATHKQVEKAALEWYGNTNIDSLCLAEVRLARERWEQEKNNEL